MKVSFKQAFLLHKRALKLLSSRVRQLFPSYTIYCLVSALVPYAGIWFSARIIDELAGQRRADVLWPLVVTTIVITAVLTLLTDAMYHWKMARRATMFQYLRKIYADKIMSMDFCVLDNPKTHEEYATIRENDWFSGWGLTRVIFYYEDGMSALFRILGAVVLTVSLFTIPVPESAGRLAVLGSPVFVPIVIALLFGVTLLGPLCNQKADNYWAKNEEEGKLSDRLMHAFGFLPLRSSKNADFRIYNQQNICKHYNDMNRNYMPGGTMANYAKGPMGLLRGLAAAIAVVFIGLVYVFVCLKASTGAFSVGSVTQYIGAITALSQGLGQLLNVCGEMRVNGMHLRTVFEFLDKPNHMVQGEREVPDKKEGYQIEFKDVSFRYPGAETDALSHVTLTFSAGEKLALVGRNGSGKTTFIKLLCRLYDPTEGAIYLNGVDIREYDYSSYLATFSVVFQDFQLFGFPLGQNIAAGYEYDKERAETCIEQAGFTERLKTLPKGLDTYLYPILDKEGVELSGGEAQKVAIARALYKDSGVMVLDEPTAALDPLAEADIYTRFNQMVSGKSAIYISHRLSSCRFCDRIAVFSEGKMVQYGTHDELVNIDGHYGELWQAQAQYYVS